MAIETVRAQREQNLLDALNLKEPDKVPIGLETMGWPLVYAGTDYEKMIDDPEALTKAYLKFFDDVPVDYFALNIGIAMPLKMHQALGSEEYFLSHDKILIQHNQAAENLMRVDEYGALIDDIMGFRAGTLLKRRFPIFDGPKDVAYEALKKAAIGLKEFYYTNALIRQGMLDRDIVPLGEIGPNGSKAPVFYSAFNIIFDFLRGIKGALVDLRRRPDVVREAVQAIEAARPPHATPPEYFLENSPLPLAMTIYHSECFLNPKQFDEFYFEPFKKQVMPYMECGAKYYLKGEGQFLSTLDRFKELPKGSMVFMLDEDDPFEAYKHIKDHHSIAAGINSSLLSHGTKQECIDYAKKCFDTFAPGGGFIFLPNKPLICANDAKIENIVAVYEFADEYGKKR